MMHVLIDSSIYRTDPKRTKVDFQAITRLAVAGRIQLHLPHYVREEFLTQQVDNLSKEFDQMSRAGNSVLRLINHDNTVNIVKRMIHKIKDLISARRITATEEFEAWITETNTKMHEVDDSHGKRVTDA